MNVKSLLGVFIILLTCVCAAGCIGTPHQVVISPDALVGTWVGIEDGGPVSNDLTLICDANGAAKLTGSISGGGMSKTLNANVQWEYLAGNQFILKSGDNEIATSLTGDNTLMITINPKKMGIADFDIDYNVNMKRSSGAVSTATITPTMLVSATTSPDAIVGLWNGTIEAAVSNEIMADFLIDGTGSLSVIYYDGGIEKQTKKNIVWEYIKSNEYQAMFDSTIMTLELTDETLLMQIIPSMFIPGTSDVPISTVTKSFIIPRPFVESTVNQF